MVLAVHSFYYSGPSPAGRVMDSVARAGWIGVTLFFVLSGFLITGILLDTRDREHFLRDFYARRALRIFPLYFAFLAVYLFVVPQLPYASDRLAQPPTSFYYWTYLANMQEWLSGIAATASPLGPLWSLAVEEQIYLVWPFLILLVAGPRLPTVWVTLAGASVAWRLWTRFAAQSIEASYAWSPANLEAFAAGALVAWLLRHERRSLAVWAPRVAIAAGMCVALLWTRLGHFNFWSAPVEVPDTRNQRRRGAVCRDHRSVGHRCDLLGAQSRVLLVLVVRVREVQLRDLPLSQSGDGAAPSAARCEQHAASIHHPRRKRGHRITRGRVRLVACMGSAVSRSEALLPVARPAGQRAT